MRTTSGHDQVAPSLRSRDDPHEQQRWAALASTRPAPLTEFAVNTVSVLSRAAPAASHCRTGWTRPARFPRNLGCSSSGIAGVGPGADTVEVQGLFKVSLDELRATYEGVLPGLLG